MGKISHWVLVLLPRPLEPQGAHGAHPKSIFLQVYFIFYSTRSLQNCAWLCPTSSPEPFYSQFEPSLGTCVHDSWSVE